MPLPLIDRLALLVARMEPAGLSPRAPGTVASAVAALLAPWLFLPLGLAPRLVLLAAVFVGGAWVAGRAEIILGQKDPGSVVIDELAGQWIVLLPVGLMPFPSLLASGPLLHGVSLWLLMLAFVLFRLFDITKIGPIGASEHWMPGGWGVMLDDVMAGLAGMGVMLLLTLLA